MTEPRNLKCPNCQERIAQSGFWCNPCRLAFRKGMSHERRITRMTSGPASVERAGSEPTKHDDGKARLDLLPPEPLVGAAEVLAFGAAKYGERNWEAAPGLKFGRLYGAAMRHMSAWWWGEEQDEESSLHHLHHAICCLLMLSATLQRSGPGSRLDDRGPSRVPLGQETSPS